MAMYIESLKATWASYSTKKKWLIAGGAVVLVCAVSNLEQTGAPGQNRGVGPHAAYTQGAYINQGQPAQSNAGYYNPGYANQGYNGGYIAGDPASNPYNHPDTTDITSGYYRASAANDRAFHNQALLQRDETDVQNLATGEVTNEVSNTYATPAIESGAYVEAPAPATDDGN